MPFSSVGANVHISPSCLLKRYFVAVAMVEIAAGRAVLGVLVSTCTSVQSRESCATHQRTLASMVMLNLDCNSFGLLFHTPLL